MIRPMTLFYNANVPVLSVNGRYITTGWTFLPLYTGKSDVTFRVISIP
jgi:hypothetical protein